MPSRVVEISFIGNMSQLYAAMDRAGLLADKTGTQIGDSFSKGAAKAGTAIKGLSVEVGKLDVAGAGSLNKFGSALASIETKSKSLSATVASIGKGVAVGGLAAFAAAAYEGVKGATALQQQMEMIHTQAGAAQSQVTSMTKSILGMAASVGTNPQQLAAGLYHIESAGYRGAQALNMLQVAAKGAKIGNSDLTETAQTLAAAIYSNIPGAQNLQQAMGALNATVGAGDMTMSQLNEAFQGPMLATVKGYGLSIQDVGAALADFGDLNIRGADAATQLRMAVQYMAKPAATAGPMLKALGLNTQSFATALQNGGLLPAIQLLQQRLQAANVPAKQYAQVVSDLFSKKGSSGVEILLNSLDRLQSKYKDIQAGAGSFGADWTATTKNLSFQWSQVEAGASAFADKLGGYLIPKLQQLGQFVARNQGAFEELAKVIGVLLVGAVAKFVQTSVAGFTAGITAMISKMAAAATAEEGMAAAMADAATSMIASIASVAAPLAALLIAMKAYQDFKDNSGQSSIAPTGNLQTAIAEFNKTGLGVGGKNNAAILKSAQAEVASYDKAHPGSNPGGRPEGNAGIGGGFGYVGTTTTPKKSGSGGGPNSAVSAALAGPAATVSTALTAAQVHTELQAIAANETLKLATSSATGGSSSKLQSALTAVHQAGFTKLIAALNATGNAQLAKLAATMQTTLATALTKLADSESLATYAKANVAETIAQTAGAKTTAAGNAGSAQVNSAGLLTQQAVDKLNAAAAAVTDAAKLQTDAAQMQLQAIQDQITATNDAAGAQVSAINDAAQTQVDTLGERGLYGLALQAQLAKVAVDQQKATDDAQIAAAQAHLDSVTSQTNQAVALAQTNSDSVQQQADAAESKLQATADSTAISSAISVAAAQATADQDAVTAAINDAAAQAHVDAVQFGSQQQQQQAAAQQKLVQSQGDKLTALANQNLTAVTNSSNLSTANAQNSYTQAQAYWSKQIATATAALNAQQSDASTQQALAQQSLSTISNSAQITEAKLTSIYNVDQELATTQFSGGYEVNIYAQPGDGPQEYASAIGFQLRTLTT